MSQCKCIMPPSGLFGMQHYQLFSKTLKINSQYGKGHDFSDSHSDQLANHNRVGFKGVALKETGAKAGHSRLSEPEVLHRACTTVT